MEVAAVAVAAAEVVAAAAVADAVHKRGANALLLMTVSNLDCVQVRDLCFSRPP